GNSPGAGQGLEKHDGRDEGAGRAAAFAALDHLPPGPDDADVDRPPDHRGRALFRYIAGRLVADGGGDTTQTISRPSELHGEADSSCSGTPGRSAITCLEACAT